MAEWGVNQRERPPTEEREPNDPRGTDDASPGAEEILRIVDVSEALGISPAVAAAALRDDEGRVSTGVRLRRSIERVEERLNVGGRLGRGA